MGKRIKAALNKRRSVIFDGDTDGLRIAQAIARDIDALIEYVYKNVRADNDNEQSPPRALVAIGGYGRGVSAPYSDLDLLILHDDEKSETLDPFVRSLLYPFWDAGVTVGQSVHTPASAMRLASKDSAMLTSYLDRRLIVGDQSLFDKFARRFEKHRIKTMPSFTRAKIKEQQERRDSFSPYGRYTEPRVKDGRGGLRDVDIIDWLHAYNFGESVWSLDGKSSLLSKSDIASLRKARRFLVSVRVHLHDVMNRPGDQVVFEVQPALAERLGYRPRHGQSAAERLMTHYALISEDVDRLGRLVALRLEEAQARLSEWRPSPTPKSLQSDEVSGRVNVRLRTGRLDFATEAGARERPLDLFRIFRAQARKRSYELHPNAASLISEASSSFPRDARSDLDIAVIFTATLLTAKTPSRVLNAMTRTGLLGKYIPIFDRLAGRVEYGLYRRYALDKHVFLAMDTLADVRFGRLSKDYPLTTQTLLSYRRRLPFYLAVLLHETRAVIHGANTADVEDVISETCILLGARPEEVESIVGAIINLGSFIRMATRRNLGHPAGMMAFCDQIKNIRTLDILLVLAFCHLRVVREDAWDDWTRMQVRALYEAAHVFLKEGESGLKNLQRQKRLNRMQALTETLNDGSGTFVQKHTFVGAADNRTDAIHPVIEELADEVFGAVPPRLLNIAAKTWYSSVSNHEDTGVTVTSSKDSVEAIVYAQDRPGLLADLTGVISASGGSLRTVHAITLDDHTVVDIFVLRAPGDDDAIVDPSALKKLEKDLFDTAVKAPEKAPAPVRRVGDKRAFFRVPPDVRVDLDASDECLVVEAEGRDRPGLVRDLTRALVDVGVLIESAHIATYGEKAIDVFYLQDAPGYKITNKRRIESIKRRLYGALEEEG